MRGFFRKLGASVSTGCTTLSYFNSPLCSVSPELAYICSSEHASAAKLFARIFGKNPSLFSSCTSLTPGFIQRDSLAT
jgi:hypothetical protein